MVSSLSITLILSFVFAALYAVERKRDLELWAIAWLAYAFRFLFEILEVSHPTVHLFFALRQVAMLVSADVVIFSAYRLIGGRSIECRALMGAMVILYVGLSIAMGFGSELVTSALFIATGIVYIWLGVAFFLRVSQSPLGRPIAGVSFILWGAHKIDYPVLLLFARLLPWGYFLASFLNLVVGVGVLIRLYEILKNDLLRREERFRLIFDNTGDAIFVHDLEGRLLETNRVACERLGYQPAEMQTVHLRDILEPGAFSREGRELAAKVKELGRFAYESVHVTRGGRRIPTEMNSSIIEYFGREAILSVARDITARKTMEDRLRESIKEKEVLIREIHHRVKNNLQVIDSLLRLQSRNVVHPDDAELFRMSQNRVHTIALIHEQLYRFPDLSGIRMRTYLGRLLGHLKGAYAALDTEISLEEMVDDVLLDIETASPCALIVNELVTNSLKHAFAGRSMGVIAVRLLVTDKPEELLLEVSDDGVGGIPATAYDDPLTFGFLLVRSLADQLDAHLSVSSDSGGTRTTLTFPCPIESE